MSIESSGHEHEIEPQYGLPERLPAGEKILWQGSPDFASLALRVFHLRKVAIYFAVLLALRAGDAMIGGGTWLDGMVALAWPLPLALTALASLAALAWMTARTAVYTLTDKRLVMRVGIVLTLTFNIPLGMVRSAALGVVRSAGRGAGRGDVGDIVIQLGGPDHIAWLNLWPHVRPWRLARPEPMLRAVPDAPRVAALLSQAWAQVTGVAPQPQPAGVAGDTAAAASPTQWQPSPT